MPPAPDDTAAPVPSPTATAPMTWETQYEGEYASLFPNETAKTLFLDQCTAHFAPAACQDVVSGSVLVSMWAPHAAAMASAKATAAGGPLDLPAFPALAFVAYSAGELEVPVATSPPSATPTTKPPTNAPYRFSLEYTSEWPPYYSATLRLTGWRGDDHRGAGDAFTLAPIPPVLAPAAVGDGVLKATPADPTPPQKLTFRVQARVASGAPEGTSSELQQRVYAPWPAQEEAETLLGNAIAVAT
eukprot:gene21846-55925_t